MKTKIRTRLAGVVASARRGLTLVELSIVILVLGILMTVLYVSIGDGQEPLQTNLWRVQIEQSAAMLPGTLRQFERETDVHLEEGDSLAMLAEKNELSPGWRPLRDTAIQDAWERPYFICLDEEGGRHICSLGADGQDGGEGPDADIFLTSRETWPAWLRNTPAGLNRGNGLD